MQTPQWHNRSAERMPDVIWRETVRRIQGEFDEMPCLRVTPDQARLLFGLTGTESDWILRRLSEEGFLVRTPSGQYVRRQTDP